MKKLLKIQIKETILILSIVYNKNRYGRQPQVKYCNCIMKRRSYA